MTKSRATFSPTRAQALQALRPIPSRSGSVRRDRHKDGIASWCRWAGQPTQRSLRSGRVSACRCGRGAAPNPPRRTGGECIRPTRRECGDRGHAPERPEQQGHNEGRQRNIAQGKRISGGKAKVWLHRLCARRTIRHARKMRPPDSQRGRIITANRLRVGKRGKRASRKAGIKAHHRLRPRRRPEVANPKTSAPTAARPKRAAAVHSASIGTRSCRPKARTARTAITMVQSGQKARVNRSAHIPACVNRKGRAMCRSTSEGSLFRHVSPSPGRTGSHSHAGMVSRESISSKVGRARMTAK